MSATCLNCGIEFEPRSKYAPSKTCSKECRYALSAATNAEVQGRYETKVCPACGEEFSHPASKPKKTCSIACRGRYATMQAKDSRTCSVCGETFTHYSRQDRNTCSVKCAAVARSKGQNYPECRACGISTGSYNRVYCDEHRPPPGPAAKPRRVATCLGCGEEFSRPGTWTGKMKYCSNECSHRQRKRTRDVAVLVTNDGTLIFHSLWEVRFVAMCERFGIPWRSYDGPPIKTSEGLYRPDFIVTLDGVDEIVEVKGWLRPESERKLADARANGHEIRVVRQEDLEEMERFGMKPITKQAEQSDNVGYLDGLMTGDDLLELMEPNITPPFEVEGQPSPK